MFTETSRYIKQQTVDVVTAKGRTVKAVVLRRISPVAGKPTEVKGTDRLDVMAQRIYEDPTKFWHIADANTRLWANDLVKQPGSIINVPEE
jgi:hypothetical protein